MDGGVQVIAYNVWCFAKHVLGAVPVFYSGEDWFKIKRFKEYSFSEIIKKFGKKAEPF
jgi:hypothetical protein